MRVRIRVRVRVRESEERGWRWRWKWKWRETILRYQEKRSLKVREGKGRELAGPWQSVSLVDGSPGQVGLAKKET